MKRLLLTVAMATCIAIQLLAQEPSVSIKIDDDQNFRFIGNRLEFLNPARNVLIGDSVGLDMLPAALHNVYIGNKAGYSDTTGQLNVFVGVQAGYYNESGHRNTFIGFGAGQSNTTGFRNTFIGLSAGVSNTTGSLNTYIGRASGWYNQTGSGNVFIGNYAGANELGSDKLYISNSDTNDPLIFGDFAGGYLKLNAWNVETTGSIMSNYEIRANYRFNVNGEAGINDTISYVTNIDLTNNLLKYRTTIFTGGILTYSSNESEWVSAVGDPIFSCGNISMIGEFSQWINDTFLTRDGSNPDAWSGYLFLDASSDMNDPPDGIIDLKFREDLSWDTNWGSLDFPAGTGIPDGPNIPVPLNPSFETTIYFVTFNCATGAYTFTDVSE
jgi:hypothetical protein